MNKQRVAIIICAAAGMLCTFMPWVNVPIVGSVNGTRGNDGWITFCLFAVPLVISLLGNQKTNITVNNGYIVMAVALVASGIGIYKIVDFNHTMGATDDNPFSKLLESTISVGFGLYLLVFAGIAIIICNLAMKDKLATPLAESISSTTE